MPYLRVVEGRLSSHAILPIAAVVFDTQALPLDSQAYQRLRHRATAPLVAIVASYDEAERALRSGCSDVLVKPVTAEELRLHIQNVLQMAEPQSVAVGALAICDVGQVANPSTGRAQADE